MAKDKQTSNDIKRHYVKRFSWLLLASVIGLSAACVNNQTQQSHIIEDKSQQQVSEQSSPSIAITGRTPTKEQLTESLRKLQSEENPDMEVVNMLYQHLQSLYETEYDFSKVDDEKTLVFSAMQKNALNDKATGRDLYYYSIIIREPRARDLLDLQLTQSQSDKLADELQAKAVAMGDLSALTKTGYDHIVEAIGKPIFSTEKIGRYYRPYYEVNIQNPEALSTSLKMLATALKSQCLVDYYPNMDYPFYYHHVYNESGDITFNKNRPIGERLNEFSRREVAAYPNIEDLLDLIYLRNYVYCYEREYVLNELSSHLTGLTDGIAAKDYSIPDVKERSPIRHRVVLSIIAELINKKELVPLFSYQLNDTDKKEFNRQREQLFNKYQTLYADSIPMDMDIE